MFWCAELNFNTFHFLQRTVNPQSDPHTVITPDDLLDLSLTILDHWGHYPSAADSYSIGDSLGYCHGKGCRIACYLCGKVSLKNQSEIDVGYPTGDEYTFRGRRNCRHGHWCSQGTHCNSKIYQVEIVWINNEWINTRVRTKLIVWMNEFTYTVNNCLNE